MELLDIKLPTIKRFQYANLESKSIWEKKIEIAKRASKQLNFLSFKHGIKDYIVWEIEADKYELAIQSLTRQNFVAVPIEKVNNISKSDSFNFSYKILISHSIGNIESYFQAKQKNDINKLSKMMKIPECCLQFEIDNNKYAEDLTWHQAENSLDSELKKNKRNYVENNFEKNLIRLKFGEEQYKIFSTFSNIGVGLINYRVCNFNCLESIDLANKLIDFGKNIRIDGIDEILDLLRLPFEWDCFKGISVINTPVFKYTTNSLGCYPNYIVQRESDYYPKEAPNGIKFPWKFPWKQDHNC